MSYFGIFIKEKAFTAFYTEICDKILQRISIRWAKFLNIHFFFKFQKCIFIILVIKVAIYQISAHKKILYSENYLLNLQHIFTQVHL